MNVNHMLVYGTLRKGQHANGMMERYGTYVETVRLAGARMFSLGGFPGISLGGHESITCDLYRIDNPELLRAADRYEGADHEDPLYFRRIVALEDGRQAYIYEYNGTGKHFIESGDWINRTAA